MKAFWDHESVLRFGTLFSNPDFVYSCSDVSFKVLKDAGKISFQVGLLRLVFDLRMVLISPKKLFFFTITA